jgi:hypothetical protein
MAGWLMNWKKLGRKPSLIRYREVLNFVDWFTVTGALLAVRHIQIFLMNQYTCWPITLE